MKLNTYQGRAAETLLPECDNINYLSLGLASEVGEVAGKLKKHIRGDGKVTTDGAYLFGEMAKELGDVLWYVAMMAWYFGYDLDDIAKANLRKLAARKEAGTIKGDGDNR